MPLFFYKIINVNESLCFFLYILNIRKLNKDSSNFKLNNKLLTNKKIGRFQLVFGYNFTF